MAYADDSLEEEQQNKQQDTAATAAPTVSGSGEAGASGSAPASTGPSTGAASGAGAKSKTPDTFADLSNYLKVNAPQEFGTQLAGKVGGDIQKGQDTLDSASQQFKERADTGTVKDTNNLTSQVATNPEGIDPNAFATLRNASYNGPVQLADASDLNSQVQGNTGSAIGKANASKTEGGRFALLDNYFSRPTYNQGQKSLDNLLVQNDPNSQQAFQQMRDNAQTLQQNVNQAGTDLGQYGAAAKSTTDATRAAADSALGIDTAGNYLPGQGAIGAEYTQLANKASTQQAATAQQQQDIQTALAGHNLTGLTPDEQQLLGLGGFSGSIYNVDPGQYFKGVDPSSITAAGVATPQDVSRWQALQGLSGGDLSGVLNTAQAGTSPTNAGTFNNAAFNSAVNQEQQSYNGDLNKQLGADFSYTPYTPASQRPSTPAGNIVNGANDTIFTVLRGDSPTGSQQQADAIKAAFNTDYTAPQKLQLMQSLLPQAQAMVTNGTMRQSYLDALNAEIAGAQNAINQTQSTYGINNKLLV